MLTEQWKKVHEAPSDFNAWTALITTAEKLVSAQEDERPATKQRKGPGLAQRQLQAVSDASGERQGQ